ncbi:diaminopimelate decarboxylase [Planctomycetales bacterium]|nr:diaminopimelate decarboxylase [Planctomycetales bacterium]
MNVLPYTPAFVEKLTETYPTPFYLYDEKTLRKHARLFNQAFAWNTGFKEYFAVKANPNPVINKILQSENLGGDCSSLPELVICERIGTVSENIMFTSNNTPAVEFVKAAELGAIINLDDITHIDFLEKSIGQLPELLSFRWNPGALRDVESVIGNPVEAKYGLTTEQLFEAYRIAKQRGVKRFGLHTMVASNLIDPLFFRHTAQMMLGFVRQLERQTGVRIEFVNLGGGFGVAYKPEQKPLDILQLGACIREEYESAEMAPLKIYTESGRLIAAEAGTLITRVIHEKNIYKRYIGVDASMANLMRPGLYGAYHHITVLKDSLPQVNETVDVVGSLCENCDKFAIDRNLPKIGIGDLLAIHDAGAHGYAMGFQYNGKLRCAELLLQEDGTVRQIRRAETLDDYLATLDFCH